MCFGVFFRRIDRTHTTAAEKKRVKFLPQQQEKHPHPERDETSENRKRYERYLTQ